MKTHVINGPAPRFSDIATAAATTAATAAATGGASLVADALVGVVSKLFGGKKKRSTDPRSDEFKQFVAGVGGGAFQAWVEQNQPDAVTWSKREILPLFYVWLYDTGKSVLWWTNDLNPTAPAAYIPGFTEEVYRSMGIDYMASALNRQRNSPETQGLDANGKWRGWVMLPGAGSVGMPQPAVTRLQNALDNAKGTLSNAAAAALQGKLNELKGGDVTPPADNNSKLLLFGGALLLLLAMKK